MNATQDSAIMEVVQIVCMLRNVILVCAQMAYAPVVSAYLAATITIVQMDIALNALMIRNAPLIIVMIMVFVLNVHRIMNATKRFILYASMATAPNHALRIISVTLSYASMVLAPTV
jgi:hypothetical protein